MVLAYEGMQGRSDTQYGLGDSTGVSIEGKKASRELTPPQGRELPQPAPAPEPPVPAPGSPGAGSPAHAGHDCPHRVRGGGCGLGG